MKHAMIARITTVCDLIDCPCRDKPRDKWCGVCEEYQSHKERQPMEWANCTPKQDVMKAFHFTGKEDRRLLQQTLQEQGITVWRHEEEGVYLKDRADADPWFVLNDHWIVIYPNKRAYPVNAVTFEKRFVV